MATKIVHYVLLSYNFLFNNEISSVRNILDIALSNYTLQFLSLTWAASFWIAIGSCAGFATTDVWHTLFIAAAAVTVATLTSATTRPQLFARILGRDKTGEHD